MDRKKTIDKIISNAKNEKKKLISKLNKDLKRFGELFYVSVNDGTWALTDRKIFFTTEQNGIQYIQKLWVRVGKDAKKLKSKGIKMHVLKCRLVVNYDSLDDIMIDNIPEKYTDLLIDSIKTNFS